MTEIKDLNKVIAGFIGRDPWTLNNMGEVSAEFKEDVVELLEEAFIHEKKMRVMKELLEFAASSVPFMSDELEKKMYMDIWLLTVIDQKRCDQYIVKFNLWALVSRYWSK
jgi:hypothetical protein